MSQNNEQLIDNLSRFEIYQIIDNIDGYEFDEILKDYLNSSETIKNNVFKKLTKKASITREQFNKYILQEDEDYEDHEDDDPQNFFDKVSETIILDSLTDKQLKDIMKIYWEDSEDSEDSELVSLVQEIERIRNIFN